MIDRAAFQILPAEEYWENNETENCLCRVLRRHKNTHNTKESLVSTELLLSAHGLSVQTEDVESHGLGKGSALPNGDSVADVKSESGGTMSRGVAMALLVSVVLFDQVNVISSHNDGVLHLIGLHDSSQNSAPDGDISGERAFLVNVGSF